MEKVKTGSYQEYQESSIKVLKSQLQQFMEHPDKVSIEEIKSSITEINAYPNLEKLQPLGKEHVTILDEDELKIDQAKQTVLNGEFFWEHAAAGEATRLGMGPKYLLEFHNMDYNQIAQIMNPERKKDGKEEITIEQLKELCGGELQTLLPLKLGSRHMLQMAFDVIKLAKEQGADAKEVLKKQKTFVAVSESNVDKVIDDFKTFNFFGLDPKNVFFMIQRSFHGIDIDEHGNLFYDEDHKENKRLHNHGQMVLQKAHDNVIFFIDVQTEQRIYLTAKEFEDILSTQKDMVSYNIEDIGYLTQSIDWSSLALALNLSEEGYEMMMEIVAQNPEKPQKGGAAFFDPILNRACVIESNRLLNIQNEEIKHLNKNFNHYPKPATAFRKMKEHGLPMPFEIKKATDKEGNPKEYIYFNPVQGDLNFLLKTAYVMRKELKAIQNLKTPATIPPTIRALRAQDEQEGFKEFVQNIQDGKYN